MGCLEDICCFPCKLCSSFCDILNGAGDPPSASGPTGTDPSSIFPDLLQSFSAARAGACAAAPKPAPRSRRSAKSPSSCSRSSCSRDSRRCSPRGDLPGCRGRGLPQGEGSGRAGGSRGEEGEGERNGCRELCGREGRMEGEEGAGGGVREVGKRRRGRRGAG
ncbi:hypothetical protein DFJ74DRAFT_688326 [Hyaloraphidium curvatum]|nr:hypothetical protein DFJ74DRAFT_688326 [Hyaloraphidium curvatum]